MGFFGTILGTDAAKASNQAAADQYAKQIAAANEAKQYSATLPGKYAEVGQAYQPYTQAGTGALQQLMAGLGLGGDQGAFTQAYQNLPGYQSGLATGQQTAERALNASRGGLNSGAALKGLYRYGSDYENQRSGDYLSRLASLSGMGLQATGGQTGLEAQGLGAGTGVYQQGLGFQYGGAPTVGQGMVAGAQSQQQGLQNVLNLAANLGGKALSFGMGGFPV